MVDRYRRRVTLRYVDRHAASDPVGALVFFHGYGEMPDDFVVFLDRIDPERRFHGYLPQGHTSSPMVARRGSSAATEPPETQLALVVDWLEALPYPRKRTVLVGWSQRRTSPTH